MYGAYISEKGPVLNVHIPRDIMCLKERDPASVALDKSVNIKMNQAIESILPKQEKKLPHPVNKIKIISYEEAVKELATNLKSTNKVT